MPLWATHLSLPNLIKLHSFIFSVYVFFKTPKMNSRFLLSLKIYSINSFLLNLNDVIILILYFACNNIIWEFNYNAYMSNTSFVFYYMYIYLPIWRIIYTLGGFINIQSNITINNLIDFFLFQRIDWYIHCL